MQSGTTGINPSRIYHPQLSKESIKIQMVLSLSSGFQHYGMIWNQALIHTPFDMKAKMNGYPMPIIEEKV